jgi:hypothetical protein
VYNENTNSSKGEILLFDPILILQSHIALLTLVEDTKKEVESTKGIIQMAAKSLGRSILAELEKSRKSMKANKMWVDEKPLGERRYHYSIYGRREVHEISPEDLDLQRGMMIRSLERNLEELKERLNRSGGA